MIFSKKNTYEQHDNEKGSFYRNSIDSFNSNETLDDYTNVDVCVIGGGFTGVSSAINLSKKGYSVALCEARQIGWGASGRNGGQLGIGMRKDQNTIETTLGFDHARELWNLGLESVTECINLIKENNIACGLQKGLLDAGYFAKDKEDFLFKIEHMQKNYNFEGYEFINQKQIKEEINCKLYSSGLLNNFSYHLNPLKFLIGLARLLIKYKVKVYENTPITNIVEAGDNVKIYSNKKIIKANKVVVGCNGYLDKLLGKINNNFMPINNYMIATEPLGEKTAGDIIKNNYAICDTRFIIDYYRFSEDWRMIFGGGETYSSKFLNNSKNFVLNRMYKVFPMLKGYKIEYSWGGTLAITVNRLPDFGTLMNNKLLYAQGYSGHGLSLSTFAGKLIAEKIDGFNERFDLFSKINHLSIPGGSLVRRPIYSTAIFYYKLRDLLF
jgi:gamma-glutamylputrescine oxidase